VYPKNQTFTENVVLKFNMFLNFISPPTGTTESSIFGINHSGTITNRHAKAGSDGVWFAVESDGSAQGGRSYVVYHPVNTTSVPALDSRHANTLTEVFPNPPFLAAGAAAGQWVDVTVRQEHRLVTWDINGVEILRWPNTNMFTTGTIMLGHMDSFNSVGSTNNLTLFDNVRVWNLDTALPPASVLARTITVANGTVSILFRHRQWSVRPRAERHHHPRWPSQWPVSLLRKIPRDHSREVLPHSLQRIAHLKTFAGGIRERCRLFFF
jgi:hypothetical protein